jgi:hypothetical protein
MDDSDNPPFPHIYFSTYCIHEIHDQCRLTCKICRGYCHCFCHTADPDAAPTTREQEQNAAREALVTVAHDHEGVTRWRLIKVREAVKVGLNMQQIGNLIGVSRQTVARWCR